MKIKGATVPAPEPITVNFYRGTTVIKLQLQAVLSFEEFDRLVPIPKPPLVTNVKDKTQTLDFKSREYISKMEKYAKLKSAYIAIKGLESTEGLSWDTVNINEPDTWVNYQKELEVTFTDMELNRLVDGINEANNPTERRLTEAFNSFTPSQDQEAGQQEGSSLPEGQPATASGEPANDSK